MLDFKNVLLIVRQQIQLGLEYPLQLPPLKNFSPCYACLNIACVLYFFIPPFIILNLLFTFIGSFFWHLASPLSLYPALLLKLLQVLLYIEKRANSRNLFTLKRECLRLQVYQLITIYCNRGQLFLLSCKHALYSELSDLMLG